MSLTIGMILFPGLTNLDLAGPFEVLAKLPETRVDLLWKTIEPVVSDAGQRLIPSRALADAPQYDILFVPGGPGQVALMDDSEVIDFVRRQGEGARWVTSVCTGALVLGAAGLLAGYRAATHWTAMDQLALFGAIPTQKRVVQDRNRLTGGGVTAGIDFGLTLAALLFGEDLARRITLGLEYAPEPPFECGTPERASPALIEELRSRGARRGADRLAASQRAAARLNALT
ncbi:DJ-1/PfpI family protein [Sphingomonas sp. So64.6b]|uniref:DJ-1/PfpI family protein n=1 Tax=Sphingomonas sp. So64.6b TaxID=2997354 RepID=UPI001603A8FC|nr:DJ-1/PfpI family protein [Sphingomonas sp. So64.6b]QNA85494.1 DJ-1/PfpI family protein [Sphingomonas sp. So64.6b]